LSGLENKFGRMREIEKKCFKVFVLKYNDLNVRYEDIISVCTNYGIAKEKLRKTSSYVLVA